MKLMRTCLWVLLCDHPRCRQTKSRERRPMMKRIRPLPFSVSVLTMGALLGLGVLCLGQAQAAQILSNPGFESGSLSPWFQDRDFGGVEAWNVTSSDAHSGTFSATDVGNKEIRQNFAAIPTSLITDISFWAKHPDASVTALFVDLFYSDSTAVPEPSTFLLFGSGLALAGQVAWRRHKRK
jgi:hypothetical protein